jgi:hypothetical protein
MSYPRLRLGSQSELFVVCIYGFCVFDRVAPVLRLLHCRTVHFITLDPIDIYVRPIKNTLELRFSQSSFRVLILRQCAFGGPAGNCPRVLNPFQSTSYNHKFRNCPGRPGPTDRQQSLTTSTLPRDRTRALGGLPLHSINIFINQV